MIYDQDPFVISLVIPFKKINRKSKKKNRK